MTSWASCGWSKHPSAMLKIRFGFGGWPSNGNHIPCPDYFWAISIHPRMDLMTHMFASWAVPPCAMLQGNWRLKAMRSSQNCSVRRTGILLIHPRCGFWSHCAPSSKKRPPTIWRSLCSGRPDGRDHTLTGRVWLTKAYRMEISTSAKALLFAPGTAENLKEHLLRRPLLRGLADEARWPHKTPRLAGRGSHPGLKLSRAHRRMKAGRRKERFKFGWQAAWTALKTLGQRSGGAGSMPIGPND
jgi:hypothetical protein